MKIATLLIHYKIDHLTDIAVEQLLAQDYEHDLFVVDGGSPVAYRNESVKILRSEENLGLAGSINLAMEYLDGFQYDAVWHYTNDVTSSSDVLGSLVSRLMADPTLAAVQPSMPSSHAHLRPRDDIEFAYVHYLEWAAVLVNMKAWEDVGPLDVGFNFFSMDLDWSHRVKKKGWQLGVDYLVPCGHEWRGTHNATGFDIGSQAWKEHAYGTKKYGRADWQIWLKGEVR